LAPQKGKLTSRRERRLAPEVLQRTVYRVDEYEMLDVPLEDLLTDGELDLDPDGAGRYFTFQLKKGKLRLQAGWFIGYIPINDRVAIEVSPRCPIANLGRILRIGGFAPRIIENYARKYRVDPTELPDLRDLYAESLLEELRVIEAQGRIRDYSHRTERTSSPRGRLVLGSVHTQMAAAGGSTHVTASWFERTADMPANRCLKMAIWLLGRAYAQTSNLKGHQRRLSRRLNAAYPLFLDAAFDARMAFLSDPYVTGEHPLPSTRTYYRNALDIARIVVTGAAIAIDRPGADVRMPSVLIQMDTVFESYVRTVLQRGIPSSSGLHVLDGNGEGSKRLFDTEPSEPARPDVVVVGADDVADTARIVIDVKYKPAEKAPDRTDLNQVITYAASYRAKIGIVVQPGAEASMRKRLVHIGDMESLHVYQYVIDLDANLEQEEAEFSDAVRSLAEGSIPPASTEPQLSIAI
jgi:5-methylcytosine-specific restriction enzyme subunit McrC